MKNMMFITSLLCLNNFQVVKQIKKVLFLHIWFQRHMLSNFIMHYLKDANDSLVVKDNHKYNLQSALRKTTPITYFVQKSRDPDFTTHKVFAIRPSCLSHLDISAPHFNIFNPKHIENTIGLSDRWKKLVQKH